MQSGWYPDPSGRHELRYFNGNRWTGDVADDGVQRAESTSSAPLVDGPGPAEPRPSSTVASLTLGVIAFTLSLVVVLFFLAAPLGLVAAIVGVVGLRRSGRGRPGRKLAVWGVVLGTLAIVVSAAGVAVFRDDLRNLADDLQREFDPYSATVQIDRCERDGTGVAVSGTVRNTLTRAATYEVTIEVLPAGVADPLGTDELRLALDPEGSQAFESYVEVGALETSTAIRCSGEALRTR
ncbi:MAG: DUF2510 domain-containing protein [Ilumatobacteraceae bacterium]